MIGSYSSKKLCKINTLTPDWLHYRVTTVIFGCWDSYEEKIHTNLVSIQNTCNHVL